MYAAVAGLVMALGLPVVYPPVAVVDLAWFPATLDIVRHRTDARAHLDFVKEQRQLRLQPHLPWAAWEEEAAHAFLCWDLLMEASFDNAWRGGQAWQIQCLQELRDRIGPEAYYFGAMPRVYVVNMLGGPEPEEMPPELD